MANPTIHFEVLGKDRDALKTFYSELFGWKTKDVESARGDAYAMVEAEDGGIGGGIGTAPEGTEGHVTFYVGVEDLEAALAKAESLGGKRMTDPMDIPNGQIAHFTDPEGHMIGLATGGAEAA
jgi:predicted enzyme related to lactoylglutathione lyase